MSNRYLQQFMQHLVHGGVWLQGLINLVLEAKASLVSQGVTYTAVAFGSSGNSITVAITGGGTAGAEVVSVVGNDISVQVEEGVSTVTQVRTAVNASVPAALLVLASGTNAATLSALAAASLAGGIDGVVSSSIMGASAAQTGVGEVTITLDDTYAQLEDVNVSLEKSIAQDLIPQVKSNDMVTAKTIVINLLTGATKTDPLAAASLHVSMFLRNSSVPY